jgi:hypothetical protein
MLPATSRNVTPGTPYGKNHSLGEACALSSANEYRVSIDLLHLEEISIVKAQNLLIVRWGRLRRFPPFLLCRVR